MVRPASHSHSNGAAGTTQIWRPSTKKITADAASGGSRSARSVVWPLMYESASGERMVSRAAGGGACANTDSDTPAARASMVAISRPRLVIIGSGP